MELTIAEQEGIEVGQTYILKDESFKLEIKITTVTGKFIGYDSLGNNYLIHNQTMSILQLKSQFKLGSLQKDIKVIPCGRENLLEPINYGQLEDALKASNKPNKTSADIINMFNCILDQREREARTELQRILPDMLKLLNP
jgi:hypothetical protein